MMKMCSECACVCCYTWNSYTYTGELASWSCCVGIEQGWPPSSKNRRKVNSKKACSGCFPFSNLESTFFDPSESLVLNLSGSTGSKLDVSVRNLIVGFRGAGSLRRHSKFIPEKNWCSFTSVAPFRPSLVSGPCSNLKIRSLVTGEMLVQWRIVNVSFQFITCLKRKKKLMVIKMCNI